MKTDTKQRGRWWHIVGSCSTVSSQRKLSAIFREMFGIFRGITKLLFILIFWCTYRANVTKQHTTQFEAYSHFISHPTSVQETPT